MEYLKSSKYPDCILEFYSQYEPQDCVEINGVRLWPINELKVENEDGVPIYPIYALGFRAIASTIYGDVYCLNVNQKMKGGRPFIYIASHEDNAENLEDEIANGEIDEEDLAIEKVADSFEEFLKKFITEKLPDNYSDAVKSFKSTKTAKTTKVEPLKKEFNHPMTKWSLYKNAIRPVSMAALWFGGGLFVFIQIVTFFVEDPLSWQESITAGLGAGAVLFSLMAGICSIDPLHGVYRLTRQEKILNFSFADEMKQNAITGTMHECTQWFIHSDDTTVLAFHRNYIQEIVAVDAPNKSGSRLIMTIITVDDKKLKIQGLPKNIKKLENWFLQIETK
jgi:hypothetical protein